MRSRLVIVSAAFAFAAACGGGGTDTTNPSSGNNNGNGNPTTSSFTISTDSGFADRTATVGTTIPARVHVTNANVPVPNVTVTWTVTAGNGKVANPTSLTDANGAASTNWTIGDTVRVNTLSASITGGSTTLQVEALGGAATTLVKASPDSSAVVAGASLLLAVRATDKFGNPSPNLPVNWSATNGTLSIAATTTGNSGRAEVVFSTPAKGSYTVTANGGALGTLTFKVVGL